jgi:hypothetical protein
MNVLKFLIIKGGFTMSDLMKDRQEYWERLHKHDWYYAFSDDHRVWSAGNRVHSALSAEADTDEWKGNAFEAWSTYVSETIRGKRPERPKFEDVAEPVGS